MDNYTRKLNFDYAQLHYNRPNANDTIFDRFEILVMIKNWTMKTKLFFVLAVFFLFSEITFAQNLREMYPELGRSLKFDPAKEESWNKAGKIMEENDKDTSRLTAEQKLFLKRIGYRDENKNGYKKFDRGWDGYYYSSKPYGCSWYCGGIVDSISASSYLK